MQVRKDQMCSVCDKGPRIAVNRPHSMKPTKRVVRPNLQKHHRRLLCAKCLRSQFKTHRVIQ